MRAGSPGGLWTRRSLRFQAVTLLAALVTVFLVARGVIITSLADAQQQSHVADAAASLRSSAYVYSERITAEEGALDEYSLTQDASKLVVYERDRQRAIDARVAFALMPASGSVAAERTRLLAAADAVQIWTEELLGRLENQEAIPTSFWDAGAALDETLDAEAGIFDLRAGSVANTAREAAAAADQQILISSLVGVGVGIAGLLLLAWLFFIGTLRPISRLAAVATQLSKGGEAVIPTGEGTQEIRELSQALAVWRRLTDARLQLAEDMAAVNEQVDPDEVLGRAGRLLARQFSADLVGISVLDPENELITHLSTEPGLGLGGMNRSPVPPGSPVSQCLRTRRPFLTDAQDARWPAALTDFAKQSGLASLMVVPMISAGELVGAAALARRSDQPAYTRDDLSRAQMTIPQVASSLNVARLIKYLEHANRHKSEFLAHMSHELRTPLNSILGFAQLLAGEDYGPLNERQRRYVEHVTSSGAHLLSLINDVLDLTKVEAGQLELITESVALKQLLTGCADEIAPLARHKSQRLVVKARGNLSVRADARRLRQVMLNLVSNAIKFTPEGGTVVVETERDGSEVLVHVRDNGVGVPAGERERIFEAFTQVRTGRTRSDEGTGLGLALSRRLMELMGGALVLDARPGRGSTFTVRLPAVAGAAAPAAV
ncbi:MAG TPA: GAF domain-containing sensor histidine kinase [Candidatus Dormibacteraeota bacterium]